MQCSSSYYYHKKYSFPLVSRKVLHSTCGDATDIQIQHAFKALYRAHLVEFLKRATTGRTEVLKSRL